ncbi:MAG: 16S rRNA (cytidine(1402)-2'-O)-methyltransferase [bacterium TMED88]|nr:16S rRNA (cytidine(1402)-2'-O)-methyltransferase [Deltaproteobacteria bacterium]OUV32735.1 MAG: 16S rRNA (cytidine(1402)-2'-O)-methyltransferase [bacterium TMED88]
MGTLHVVATPIGNLEDMTLRSLRVLREADAVYAEDTRRTRVLLERYEIQRRLTSLHAHNESSRLAEVLGRLAEGEEIALVTDAGTPLISDPGGRLVEAAADAGHQVTALPGPSAVLAAVASCGLRITSFTFLGFPPRRSGPRQKLFESYVQSEPALVLFESPQRLASTLVDLVKVFGPNRRACVARELTKMHEEIVRGSLADLQDHYAQSPRGEIALVVEGAQSEDRPELEPDEIERSVRALVDQGLRAREIASELAGSLGVPRREIYAIAVRLLQAVEAEEEPSSGRYE